MPSIKDKIKKMGFSPKKSLGQNFLINPIIIQKIINSVAELKPSLIMEVGPGLGALTNHFIPNHRKKGELQKFSSPAEGANPPDGYISLNPPLYVLEKDAFLCQYWRKKGVNVWEGDVLNLKGFIYMNLKNSPSTNIYRSGQEKALFRDSLSWEDKKKGSKKVNQMGIEEVSWPSLLLPGSVLIGNLPYQIASRLMVQCCPGPDKIKALVFMFQKEVAQRILASPGSKNYGLLSVLSQCFWNGHLLIEASTSDFYPRPKVAGQVLVFYKKPHSIPNSEAFLAFVKLCFSHRRKFLLSQLKTIKEKSQIRDIFDKMNLSSSIRAEELFPGQFVSLFKEIIRKNKSEKK
ncbi:MAG: hypothetical protein OXM55_08185 [Bdellovibrionales bacterium]|nr:hypothetical protein [Bdellovibrionales bacterium]